MRPPPPHAPTLTAKALVRTGRAHVGEANSRAHHAGAEPDVHEEKDRPKDENEEDVDALDAPAATMVRTLLGRVRRVCVRVRVRERVCARGRSCMRSCAGVRPGVRRRRGGRSTDFGAVVGEACEERKQYDVESDCGKAAVKREGEETWGVSDTERWWVRRLTRLL